MNFITTPQEDLFLIENTQHVGDKKLLSTKKKYKKKNYNKVEIHFQNTANTENLYKNDLNVCIK